MIDSAGAPRRRLWLAVLVLAALGAVGVARLAGAGRPRVLWRHMAGNAVRLTPVVAGGRLFVAADDARCYALDAATGRLVWQRRLSAVPAAEPVVSGPVVVTALDTGVVVALSTESGQPAWWRNVAGATDVRLGTAEQAVLVLTAKGRLEALAATDGSPRWRVDLPSPPTGGPVSDGEGGAVLTFSDGHVERRDAGGRALWSLRVRSDAVRAPRLAGRDVLVLGDDGSVLRLDLSTGYARGMVTLRGAATLGAGGDAARLWLTTTDGFVYGFAAGQPKPWLQAPEGGAVGEPAPAGTELLVATRNRRVLALDATTGRVGWGVKVPGDVTARLVVDAGRAYVATWSGEVLAVALPAEAAGG